MAAVNCIPQLENPLEQYQPQFYTICPLAGFETNQVNFARKMQKCK